MPAGTIKHGRGGFTLAELVVSIAITAVIGSAVVGLATAMSTASEHGRDRYLSLQTARITMLRLQRMIRKAELVTAATPTSIAIWAEDANGDGRINQSEMVVVRLAPGTGEIQMERIVFPKEWAEATKASLDIPLELHPTTQVSGVMTLLRSSTASPYHETIVLADNVTDFNLNVQPGTPMTELVGLGMTVGSGHHAVTLRSAAHLRQAVTDLVGTADGKYVLMGPGG